MKNIVVNRNLSLQDVTNPIDSSIDDQTRISRIQLLQGNSASDHCMGYHNDF